MLQGQIAQKRGELRRAHLARVALVVKQDEPPDPLHISLLGTDAVVPHPDHFTHLVQQARWISGRQRHGVPPLGSFDQRRPTPRH